MPANSNAARDLPEGDSQRNPSSTIKTGIKDSNPRGGKTLEPRFKASEGHCVLRVRIEEMTRAADKELPEDFQIFFKQSKHATQQNYTELQGKGFLDLLKLARPGVM